MTERLLKTIYAGKDPIYEILEDDQYPDSIILRHAEEPEKHIVIFKSALHIFVQNMNDVLQKYAADVRERKKK
jgi:hypothetical protein